MSSSHAHPREQQYQQLLVHQQPPANQYQQYELHQHHSPSPSTSAPPQPIPAFTQPTLSNSLNVAFQHSRVPSHSHPPAPSHLGFPHHPAPSNASDPKMTYPDQEQYYDNVATPMLRQQSQPAHPSFLPIFTLIEDTISQEHFHPKVHYIFEDDVDTPLDLALGRLSLDPQYNEKEHTPVVHRDDLGPKGSRRRKAKPPSKDGSALESEVDVVGWPQHLRPIIIQMSRDLTHFERASSLAPDWQLTNVQIGKAPQWLVGEEVSVSGTGSVLSLGGQAAIGGAVVGVNVGGGGGGSAPGFTQEQPQEGLMLTIEGTSIPDLKKGGPSAGIGTGAGGNESLYELVDNFADRMAMIKRVIEFGQQQEFEEQEKQRNKEQFEREVQEQWHQAQYVSGFGSKDYENRVPQESEQNNHLQSLPPGDFEAGLERSHQQQHEEHTPTQYYNGCDLKQQTAQGKPPDLIGGGDLEWAVR